VTIVKNPKALTAAEAEAKRIKDRTYYVIDATQRPKEIKPPPNAADTKKTKRQQNVQGKRRLVQQGPAQPHLHQRQSLLTQVSINFVELSKMIY
jgi:hypothetical protein